MVAILHEWKPNPLHHTLKRLPIEMQSELGALCRRVFTPMIIWKLYTAPEHLFIDTDDTGQWEDDGGR